MKKSRFKKLASLAVALCLVTALFTGCNGGEKEDGDSPVDTELSEYVYVPEFVEVNNISDGADNIHMFGDRIYFSEYKQTSGPEINQETAYENVTEEMMQNNQIFAADGSVVSYDDIKYGYVLCSVKTDGTDLQETTDYEPVHIESDSPERQANDGYISQYSIDGDGNFVVCEEASVSIFDFPEGYDASQGNQDMYEYYVTDEPHYFIRRLDKTGKELSSIDLNEELNSEINNDDGFYFYIQDVLTDNAGNIFVNAGESGIIIFDKDGKRKSKVDITSWVSDMFVDNNGDVAVVTDDENGMIISKIDVETGELADKTTIPNRLYSISAGGGDFEYISNDGTYLFGFNSGDTEATEILNWLNSDINAYQIESASVLDDGRVLAVMKNENDMVYYGMYREDTEYSEDESDEPAITLAYLTKTPRSEVAQKTILKLACMYEESSLRSEIMNFNKTNETVRIEIEDYSRYATDEDYMAGLTKLNTEIISGNIPDILLLQNLPYEQYAAKGLFVDLYPHIDNDSELSREDFIGSLLKAQEIDGKLYQAAPSCNISTLVASEEVVGSEIGWTMQEMLDTIKKNPDANYPFGTYMIRDSVMSGLLAMQLCDFVDWSTGECSFDSDGFKKLLEFANTFPGEYPEGEEFMNSSDYELILNGDQLFQLTSIYDTYSLREYKALYGDTYIYKGIPCSDKSGNIANFDSSLAITTACKDEDAAWQFVRSLLTEDYQKKYIWGVPTRQDVIDDIMKQVLKEAEEESGGGCVSSIGYGDFELELKPIEQSDADKFMAAINSVTKSAQYDEDIMQIVRDESDAYFNGQKTVDDVASIIQSRVSIYVNEQK